MTAAQETEPAARAADPAKKAAQMDAQEAAREAPQRKRVTRPGAPKPVTPMGLLVAKLADLAARIEDQGLREAYALAAGLDPYVAAHTTPESPALRTLAEATAAYDWNLHRGSRPLEQEMLSGHLEGQLLKTLAYATQARHVLDVGMFTGYSSLAMAEALPGDGWVVACEVDPGVAAFAERHFREAGVGDRIVVVVGPAADSLAGLAADGQVFDLIFLDADKTGYLGYLHAILDHGLLAPHGLICVDNTLLQGEPWATSHPSPNAAAVAAFNDAVTADPRVEQVVLPIRDGLTLIRHAAGPR